MGCDCGRSARFGGLGCFGGGLRRGMGLQEVAVVALARLALAADRERVGMQPADRRADDREGRGLGRKTEVLIYTAHVR